MNFAGQNRFGEEWRKRDIGITFFRLGWWFARGLWRRVLFGRAGRLLFIGPNVKIYHGRYLQCGTNFIAERGCEINCLTRQGIIFGEKVTVGSYALIRPGNIYGGEIGEGLVVGDHSNIGPFAYIGCSGKIEIGNNVMISPRVSIYAENHVYDEVGQTIKEQGVTRGSVKIEDDCWIASNSVILSNVTIGRGSVVAAGSVVTKDVPPYSVVGGVPAKVLKSRKELTSNDET